MIENGKIVWFVCRESFIIGIKFPPTDPRRQETFHKEGFKAKRMSRKAAKAHGREWIWWNGRKIAYRSPEHFELIAQGIKACFMQNEFLQRALLSTDGMELIHNTGHPESPSTSLPAIVFIGILEEILAELKTK